MNAVLDQIGAELLRSAVARRRRQHRRRVATAVTAGALLVSGGAIAAVTHIDPLAHLPFGSWQAPSSTGSDRSDVVLNGPDGAWRVTAYRSNEGDICETTNPNETAAHAVGCDNGFVIADNFRANGAAVTYNVLRLPSGRLLVSGLAGAGVRSIDVQSDGAEAAAQIAGDEITTSDHLAVRPYGVVLAQARPSDAVTLTVQDAAGEHRVAIAPNVIPQP